MRYIVGYAPSNRGADAIRLASALAIAQGAELDIVHVLDDAPPAEAETPEHRTAQEIRAGWAEESLSRALSQVPEAVTAKTHVVYAESIAEGLLDAARRTQAELIIVSAARYGPLKRFTIGSVANALLHSSPIPVALVPGGYERPHRISRMTAAIGSRQGAEALVDVAVAAAARRQVPLRLVSLIALDLDERKSDDQAIKAARAHAEAVLGDALASVGDGTNITAAVAEGSTIEQAVDSLGWDDGELMIIGSSRLAEHRKIFMGSTANKILRALPIPLVVVPRVMDVAGSAQAG
jgi:nucleotide-binding universal stress UspA family protein